MKYSHMLNNYTSLNLTKLDVLSFLDEIKVGMYYTIDSERINGMPSTLVDVGRIEVVYETLPGWKSDITQCTTYEELPEAAKNYVEFVEQAIGVPVSWIGTGPEREAMVQKI